MHIKLVPPMLLALTAAQFSFGEGLDDSDARQRHSHSATGRLLPPSCNAMRMLSKQQLLALGMFQRKGDLMADCAATPAR